MYYPELMILSKEFSIEEELINTFDHWLGKRDFAQKRGLRASQLINETNIDANTAQIMLIQSDKIGILKRIYIFFCPYCTDFQRYNDLSEIEFENICRNNGETYHLKEHMNNLIIAFDVIKKPEKQGLVNS